jgi:hypothetical protein
MELLDKESLTTTINNLNNSFFYSKEIPNKDKEKVALWISTRQGLKGSYANMFAPTEKDFIERTELITGEKIFNSQVSVSHIIGEESCRALILLNVNNNTVKKALSKATEGITKRLELSRGEIEDYGFFCCGKCTVSLWRHINAGGLEKYNTMLDNGIKTLKTQRIGDGKWRRFPFYYTLQYLIESNLSSAKEEIKYTLNYCERIYKRRLSNSDEVSNIRKTIIERALNKFS